MMRCNEISRLVSESFDGKPPLRKRIELWLHLAMCKLCGGFAKEQRAFREAILVESETLEADPRLPDAKLSEEARLRIQQTLVARQSPDDPE
jgi:hypothetical protein